MGSEPPPVPSRRRRPAASASTIGSAAPRSPTPKPPVPTGLDLLDDLWATASVSLQDYVAAVSQYVRRQSGLDAGKKKAAQIRLSNALARALLAEFQGRLDSLSSHARAGESKVAGALRAARVDLVEFHPLDGLRLAVEIKPVNLAVGRAIWNRFGDVRVTAVNLHLKFPFAVVGGVLTIPTYEPR